MIVDPFNIALKKELNNTSLNQEKLLEEKRLAIEAVKNAEKNLELVLRKLRKVCDHKNISYKESARESDSSYFRWWTCRDCNKNGTKIKIRP